MNPWVKFATVAVVIYAVIVVLAYFGQRRLLYFPDTQAYDPKLTQASEMAVVDLIAEDGTRVIAWYQAAEPGKPTILLFHGNAGNVAHRDFKARLFLDQGYGVMLAGYRGYGGGEGSPTEAGLIADGRAALDYLTGEGVDGDNLVLYGESLGTGIAVRLAAERDLSALILEAPYSSIADVAASAYPFLPVQLMIKDRFDSVDHIGRVRAPILAFHGGADQVIPNQLGARLLEAANEPKRFVIIPGAGHNTVFAAGGATEALEFLKEVFP